MSRDLLWLLFCLSLAAGEALGFAVGRFAVCWPVAAGVTVVCGLFGYGLRVRGWPWAVTFLAGVTLALAAAAARSAVLETALERNGGQPYSAIACVTGNASRRLGSDGVRRVTFPATVGPVKVRVIFSPTEDQPLPRRGERWACVGWLARRTRHARAVRPFWIVGAGSSARRIEPNAADRLALAFDGLRGSLSRRLGLGLEGDLESAALNRAIVLGERAALDPALKTDFIAAGTVHVFAISGLHVMFVARFLLVLLVLCRVPLRLAGVLLVPVLWGYACLTGFPPSAVRATLMITLYFGAPLFWRRSNGLVAWALTFLIVHVLSPENLLDVGCRLSFAVMLALVAWNRWGYTPRAMPWRIVGFTVVAWFASAPLAAAAFGRLTPGGLVSNPLLVPVAGVSVTAAVCGCLVSFLSEGLAAYANNLAALGTRLMSVVSVVVARVPGASLDIVPWTPAMCVAWYVACGLVLFLVRNVLRRRQHMI